MGTAGIKVFLQAALVGGAGLGAYSRLTGGNFIDGFVAGGLGASALVVAYYRRNLPEAIGAGIGAAAFSVVMNLVVSWLGGPPADTSRVFREALEAGAWAIATNVYGGELTQRIGGSQDNAVDRADVATGVVAAVATAVKESAKITFDGPSSDGAVADIVSKSIASGMTALALKIVFKTPGLANLPSVSSLLPQTADATTQEFFATAIKSVAGKLIGEGWARLAQKWLSEELSVR